MFFINIYQNTISCAQQFRYSCEKKKHFFPGTYVQQGRKMSSENDSYVSITNSDNST